MTLILKARTPLRRWHDGYIPSPVPRPRKHDRFRGLAVSGAAVPSTPCLLAALRRLRRRASPAAPPGMPYGRQALSSPPCFLLLACGCVAASRRRRRSGSSSEDLPALRPSAQREACVLGVHGGAAPCPSESQLPPFIARERSDREHILGGLLAHATVGATWYQSVWLVPPSDQGFHSGEGAVGTS